MAWSKTKQQLESFICDGLKERMEYRSTAYKYAPDKSGKCYIAVDKKEVFSMSDAKAIVTWYKTEQEIKKDTDIQVHVTEEEIQAVRKEMGDAIPAERLAVIAKNKRQSEVAKQIMAAQTALSKSDFYQAASMFLSSSVDNCMNGDDIILNVLALVDRRVGKKRLRDLRYRMQMKHPIVQYFYKLRCEAEGI
ncbi:SF0329 family protein [Anaerosporobacter sp.]|uniref:SF0329 family protein n=1 Tax=Anaerosporobacter sp. TaxID=1872529 RepID=UPI00286F1321|nr:hypothetical protein [Anaerosporobacter sp.]